MKNYLLLFRGGVERMEDLTEEQRGEHMQQWCGFMTKLTESGNLTGGLPLSSDARLLTKSGSSEDMATTTAGEAVGGYLMIKANDYDHAIELSKGCPIFEHDGNIEIREAMEMNM